MYKCGVCGYAHTSIHNTNNGESNTCEHGSTHACPPPHLTPHTYTQLDTAAGGSATPDDMARQRLGHVADTWKGELDPEKHLQPSRCVVGLVRDWFCVELCVCG